MKVVISAGGSGGHIYPALAIINKIKEMEPNSEFLYIGTHNRMEKDIIPKYNIPFESIEIYGISKNIFKNFKTFNAFIKSYKKCRKIIKKMNPDIVIGVGGFVTGPTLYAAHKLGYKTFIHEQNSIAGKANRFLSKYVDKIAISFASSTKYFPKDKVVFTGNPCGDNALKTGIISKSSFGFDDSKKLVLIVMGSQGASTINDVVTSSLPKFENKNYQVLFVTGQNFYDKVSKNNIPSNVKVVPFIENMTRIMKNVDLMVTRAGASTLAEIEALRIPSILIPSPYVPNNHQYKNALDLVNNKKALMIEEKHLNSNVLVNEIDSLINDDNKLKELKNNMAKDGNINSSDLIYKEIKKLVDKGSVL